MLTNQEILNELMHSDHNVESIKQYLDRWNKDEEFPLDKAMQYIKLHQWKYKDFGFETEMVIREVLPEWFLKVFFDMKEFKSNSRNELTSTCEAMSKIRGYPIKTQDDKAFCQYDYSLRKYFENN